MKARAEISMRLFCYLHCARAVHMAAHRRAARRLLRVPSFPASPPPPCCPRMLARMPTPDSAQPPAPSARTHACAGAPRHRPPLRTQPPRRAGGAVINRRAAANFSARPPALSSLSHLSCF
ncbi:hypothetical protein Rsub_01113 [Raphidocelis subcapitata]|uniref:Uncharacterized protein n=1 Tax=Raphidocelis subcapitata TaxID=307507 RepID=A0A2V0NLU1_9CHLO|nr:hypothetical protein Rsub_01113 [Raphidocelis subcapitata]|eukprot:GBF88401.1 hypothetical protein Rsub_01113 [Raphidocelis subcapitata]